MLGRQDIALVALLLVLTASCSATRTSSGGLVGGDGPAPGARLLLLPVADAIAINGPVAAQSGIAAQAALRVALVSHGYIPSDSAASTVQAAMQEAKERSQPYVLQGQFTHWEDRATWTSNISDKAAMSVQLFDARSGQLLGAATHEVTGASEEYISRVPQRFIPKLADGALGRLFGWKQTVFAEE